MLNRPAGGILAALRDATAAEHRRLEAAMALDAGTLDRDRYGRALQLLHAARAGWEPELERLFPGSTGPHLGWLEADLAALELPPLPPEPPLRPCRNAGWGVRYVLEGSALGGRVVLRRARELGLGAGHGARYFAGRGAATGAHWQDFLRALDAAGTDAASPAILGGARRCFAALARRAEVGWRGSGVPGRARLRRPGAPPLDPARDSSLDP